MILGSVDTGIAGFINMQVRHADGSITDTGWFKNLILDTFFNRYAANNAMLTSSMVCRVGTGTTPPANGDTALVSQVATQTRTGGSDVLGAIDVANNRIIAKSINQFIFNIGAVVANLAEVGFEFAPSSGGLHAGSLNSRSLTKDSFGTPTPITATATDQLIVNYTIEVYTPLDDYIGSVPVSIDGVITNHDIIGRFAGDYNKTVSKFLEGAVGTSGWFVSHGSSSVFGAQGIDPTSQSGTASSTQQLFTSISGGKEREFTASVTQLNASGGIKVISLAIGDVGKGYKYQFTPVIPKTTDFSLKFRLRMTCSRV